MVSSKMSLQKKSLLAWGISFLLVLVGFGYSYLSLNSSAKITSDIVETKMMILTGVKNLNIRMLELRRDEKDFLLRKDRKYLDQFQAEVSKFKEELEKLKALSKDIPEVVAKLSAIEEGLKAYQAGFTQVVNLQLAEGLKDEGLIGDMRGFAHEIELSIKENKLSPNLLVELLSLRRHEKDFLIRRDQKYLEQFKARVSNMRELPRLPESLKKDLASYELVMQAVVDGSNLSKQTISGFRKDIHAVESNISEIEEHISGLTHAAVKEMKSSVSVSLFTLEFLLIGIGLVIFGASLYLNKVIQFINKTIHQLTLCNQEVALAASNLSSSSESLASASTEHSSSLQSTVSSLDQINAMVSENTKLSNECKDQANSSLGAAKVGSENVDRMKISMSEIEDSNNVILNQIAHSNTEMKEVLKVIQDISAKVEVINEIVFQTKLLSFNASVEAARAGEQGKGFAVVAEEVGSLATMSGTAANEIFEIVGKSISRVQSISNETAVKVEELTKFGKDKVANGIQTAEECAQSLNLISQSVNQVNQLMNHVAHASKEQSSGVNEISRAMNQFDEATQEVNAISQQNSSIAQQLNAQVSDLSAMVSGLRNVVYGSNTSGIQEEKNATELIEEKNFRQAA